MVDYRARQQEFMKTARCSAGEVAGSPNTSIIFSPATFNNAQGVPEE